MSVQTIGYLSERRKLPTEVAENFIWLQAFAFKIRILCEPNAVIKTYIK